MSTSSDETIKASTPGYRRLLSTSSTETAGESTIQYSQYRDKAPYPARALHAVLYPRPNRDLLHLQGFRTQATGEELQDLANHARVYPGHQYIRERAEFEPFYFFFHGRLKNEETLRRVCYLDNEPILTAASIEGWKKTLWTCTFAVIVPDEGSTVKGVCWKCEDPQALADIYEYTPDVLRLEFCRITTEGGEVIENGRVFAWDTNLVPMT